MNFKLPNGVKDGDHPSVLFATASATVTPEDRTQQAAQARHLALVQLKGAVKRRIVAKARELGDTPEQLLNELSMLYRQSQHRPDKPV
ncbi:hypothetical protein [Jeongeupia chitinilytica]|uniref:Uncharacterized protein n=1 Tax=Jeongeupia chitinilytica TaxID=1041641 RepID=A0ABQ3H4D7_9NEIS|nr:hypothetical protein [Jeongeupia chitinilytica]GHD66927.1 hypothetical protein GCM10007350_29880 [Jeongeupia chitinilytica]